MSTPSLTKHFSNAKSCFSFTCSAKLLSVLDLKNVAISRSTSVYLWNFLVNSTDSPLNVDIADGGVGLAIDGAGFAIAFDELCIDGDGLDVDVDVVDDVDVAVNGVGTTVDGF